MAKPLWAAFLIAIAICGLVLLDGVHMGRAQNGTNVAGVIGSDTAWTKANSPYILTGPTAVSENVTLTIEPGTEVNLNSKYIEVNGTLAAKGSISDKIYLNSGQIKFTQYSSSWDEQAGKGSIIEHAILNLVSIDVSRTSPKIGNNIFDGYIQIHEDSSSISNKNRASPIISNNTITAHVFKEAIFGGSPVILNNNIMGGIRTGGQNAATIANNTVKNDYDNHQGSEYGIKASGYDFFAHKGSLVSDNVVSGFQTGIFAGAFATIQRNLVANNHYGIDMGIGGNDVRNNSIINNFIGIVPPNSLSTGSTVIYNNIQNNTQHSVWLQSSGGVNARYNWWGTTDAQAINQSIYDFKNDFNLGTVNFVPFLTESNPQAYPNPITRTPTVTPSATLTPTETPSSTQTPAELPSQTPSFSPAPTATATTESNPTPTSTQENFASILVIVCLVIAAVVVSLLAYLAKYKGWK